MATQFSISFFQAVAQKVKEAEITDQDSHLLESSSWLAIGAAFGLLPPKEQVDVDIATQINITDDGRDRRIPEYAY
ncbi:ACT domain-containing protein ACR11-like [Gastrolobium bilobum]|uniref:ACT domain-containing protein ACR11-like n=1 Tax=Gastrolobium bilobum TaxID=150636 RepID=UPI002AAF64C7|nr:ACT domain-containing protein ACR11-like [Gastrolobium bilobum]